MRYLLKSIPFVFTLLFVSFSNAKGQTDSAPFVVDSIEIQGNEITEEFIILRELTFSKGDTVNSGILEFNKERVFSLGLFNKVEVTKKDSVNDNIVLIFVKESWYIYPVPFLNIDNNDIAKANYGFILLWKNFRGRNETVKLLAGFGFDPKFAFSYYNPVIYEKYDLSFAFSFSYLNVFNKSVSAERFYGKSFSFSHYSGMIGFGKRINQFNEIAASIGYEYIEQPSPQLSSLTSSGTGIDRHPILRLTYYYDTRDLKQFSTQGIFSSIGWTHKGLNLNNTNYNIITVDFREYRPLGYNFVGRWRFALRHVFGSALPFYDNSFIGYRETIRGHLNDYREGNNLFKSSIEIIYPILSEWDFSMKLPILPRKLTSARIGIYLEAFYDTGITFNNRERVKLNNFDNGYGVGIILLILPHNAFRLELGIDEYGNTEILFGTGFSF